MDAILIATIGLKSQLDDLYQNRQAEFQAPRTALIGRSNVGKSTLINEILGSNLARTSKSPGKTRLIHIYHSKSLKSSIVDLPGYGFAKRSQNEKEKWDLLIDDYLKTDEKLKKLLWLLDSKVGPTKTDLEAYEYLCLYSHLEIIPVFTKWDQIKTQKDRNLRTKEIQSFLKTYFSQETPFLKTQSDHRKSYTDLWKWIQS